MTAKEKFERRLKELGLYNEWTGFGRLSIENDNGIITMIHLDDKDDYSEIHFDTLNELRSNKEFYDKAIKELVGSPVVELYKFTRWIVNGFQCPFGPNDIYFFAPMKQIINFKDDEEPKGFGDIMDTLNNHDEKLVERINKLYNKYGAVRFVRAIINLYGNEPYDQLETIDDQLYEKIPMREFVYEVLEHWSADKELREIIKFVEHDGKSLPRPLFDEKKKLVGFLY